MVVGMDQEFDNSYVCVCGWYKDAWSGDWFVGHY